MNAGDSDFIPEPDETDIDGQPRIMNDRVDMGADEYAVPIECDVRIYPRVMRRGSQYSRVVAIVTLPDGVTKDQIADQPLIINPGQVEATCQFVFASRSRPDLPLRIIAVFDKAQVAENLMNPGRVELTVEGKLKGTQTFFGTAPVIVISRPSK